MAEFIKKENREAGDGSVVKSAWSICSPKFSSQHPRRVAHGGTNSRGTSNAWSSGITGTCITVMYQVHLASERDSLFILTVSHNLKQTSDCLGSPDWP